MRAFTCFAVATVFLVAPFSASRARVDVYRCVQADEHISYQQIPCHFDSKPLELKDRRSGWSALRRGEKELLESYRKKDMVHRRKPSSRRKNPVKETRSCWKKRKQLEAVRSKLRRGYKLDEGDRLRRKLDNHEDYLRQFCS